VLSNRPDEESLLGGTQITEAIMLDEPVPSGLIVVSEDDEEGDWRDKV